MAGMLLLRYEAPATYQRRFTTPDIERMLSASHHYVISRGPFVRIVRTWIEDASVGFDVEVRGSGIEPVMMRFNESDAPRVPRLSDGGRYWIVTGYGGRVLAHGNAWALASAATGELSRVAEQQVLYVGKAYGRPDANGSSTRNSHARLGAAHDKLTRIYEDHVGEHHDVFVTPLVLAESLFSSTDNIDDDEEGPDIAKVGEFTSIASEPSRVALAEEALIAYFKPEYNELLLDWGQTYTKPARQMRETGLRVLRVHLTAWNSLARFYSTHLPVPRRAHSAVFIPGSTRVSDGVDDWADTITEIGVAVEASKPLLQIFGQALPAASPWGSFLPDERQATESGGRLSGQGKRRQPKNVSRSGRAGRSTTS